MDSCLDTQTSLQTIRQSVSGSLREILDTDVYPDYPTQERRGDQTRIAVPVTLRVLGFDENGNLCACSGKGEIVQEFALSDQAICHSTAIPTGEAFSSISAGGVEVRCNLSLSTACYAKQQLRTLCGGTIEETPSPEPRPSVIIRAAKKDEELWGIAKACCSTTSAIRAANHLESDKLPDAAMLLIPVGS